MIKRHKRLSDDKATGFCFRCGNNLSNIKYAKKYCSEKCREEYYDRNYSNRFSAWIFKSRGARCEICLLKDNGYPSNLEIHHKIPLYDSGDLFNPNNIILLCHKHHAEAHRLYRLFKKLLMLLKIETKGGDLNEP